MQMDGRGAAARSRDHATTIMKEADSGIDGGPVAQKTIE